MTVELSIDRVGVSGLSLAQIRIIACRWVVAAFLSVVGTTQVLADITLVFGTYTSDKPTTVLRQFKPILEYLSKDLEVRLGEPVQIRLKIAQSYEAGIDDLVQGHVDMARFGPAAYIIAKNAEPKIGILAMETVAGEKTFKGVIVVNNNSAIQTVQDLRNRTMAFGDPASTIGRYLAQQRLVQAGITADTLENFSYLGRHDRVGAAVGQGSFDAGALKFSTFQKLQNQGVPIRILTELINVTKPWLHSAKTDQRLVSAITDALLELNDAETLKNFTKSGFVEGTDQDYTPIREAMELSKGFGG